MLFPEILTYDGTVQNSVKLTPLNYYGNKIIEIYAGLSYIITYCLEEIK